MLAHAPRVAARPAASLVCELAPHQADAMVANARATLGFADAFVRADLTGRPRVLVARTLGSVVTRWPTTARRRRDARPLPRPRRRGASTGRCRRSPGPERQRFIEQAQLDFQDFAIVGDASWTFVDGVLTLTVDLRPPA